MREPIQADHPEAERVREDAWHQRAERGAELLVTDMVPEVGQPQIDDEERDRDGEHGVGEEHQAFEAEDSAVARLRRHRLTLQRAGEQTADEVATERDVDDQRR